MSNWTDALTPLADVAILFDDNVNFVLIEFAQLPCPTLLADLNLINQKTGFELLSNTPQDYTLYPSILVSQKKKPRVSISQAV